MRSLPKASLLVGMRPALIIVAAIIIAIAGSQGCNRERNVNSNQAANPAPAETSNNGGQTVTVRRSNGLTPLPETLLSTQIETLDGKQMRLSDYSGKVVILDMWATWCGPCRNEIPELIKLSKEYEDRGVEVVGLTVDNPGIDTGKVLSFAREFNINYQLGWASREDASIIMGLSGSGSIPQTLIITRDGHVLKNFVGFHPQISPPMLRETIDEALKYTPRA